MPNSMQKATLSLEPTRSDVMAMKAEHCVTIAIPTHRSGPDVAQDRTRFKNLITKAEAILHEQKVGNNVIERITSPLRDTLADANFWRYQSDSLVAYASESDCKFVQLNSKVTEMVFVDQRPFIPPLYVNAFAPTLTLLALSWDHAKLYSANEHAIESLETDLLPADRETIVGERDAEVQLQNRSFRAVGGSQSMANFHGQGNGETKRDADKELYLTRIAHHIADSVLPEHLVIVATKEVAGHFASHSTTEAVEVIQMAPDNVPEKKIHELAIPVCKRLGQQLVEAEEQKLHALMAKERVNFDCESLEEDLNLGRVETLYTTSNPQQSQQELKRINDLAWRALSSGGSIISLERPMIGDHHCLATLRF